VFLILGGIPKDVTFVYNVTDVTSVTWNQGRHGSKASLEISRLTVVS